MTLEAFQAHLQHTASSGRTVLSYMEDARRFEDFRADRGSTIDLYEAWIETLSALRPQTVQRKRAGVNRWLAFLARHGSQEAVGTLAILQAGYRVGRKVRERDVEAVTLATEEHYQRALREAPPWGQQVASLLWNTGARVSEIVGDPIAGIPALTVERGAELVGQGHTETFGKGGRRRTLVLPSLGRHILATWRPPAGQVILFASPRNSLAPITARAVEGLFARLSVPHPHAWRHAYKTRLDRAGVRAEIVRALLGHGPRTVTDRYGQVSVREMLEVVEKIVMVRTPQ